MALCIVLASFASAHFSGFDEGEFRLLGRALPRSELVFSIGLAFDSTPLANRLADVADPQ